MKSKRLMAALMVLALLVCGIPGITVSSAQAATVNKTGYRLSKSSGTYTNSVKVKIRAKSGYKVYYSLNGTLTTGKVVTSGNAKTLKLTSSKTLTIYVVKSSKTVTSSYLKKSSVLSSADTYKYVVVSSSTIKLTNSKVYMASDISDAVTTETEDGVRTITITQAGNYTITGGSSATYIENTVINVAEDITDEVNITLKKLYIDDSEIQDVSVISVGSGTTDVNIVTYGKAVLKGPSSYSSSPASAIIYAADSSATLTLSGATSSSKLTVVDSMSSTTDFGSLDPSDGIFCKGSLVIDSGVYVVVSNGDCLKATGSSGDGGVTVTGGTIKMRSYLSNGIKTKNGCVNISGGTVKMTYTDEDGINAKNYSVNISGGKVVMSNCYGDGIQGEYVNISGGTINITTLYEYAAENYYDTSRSTYNTITKTESESSSTKVETVNVDTGSHKGIKAGSKACTYSYTSVASTSTLTAGTTYTDEASGGLTITGGTITIDTTGCGIKYNSDMTAAMNQTTTTSGAATTDGQYIYGSPDDGIKSNNTAVISGGTINIYSGDDGISVAETLDITGSAVVNIKEAYEGMEAAEVNIGASGSPSIYIYSNDDCINASAKTLSYVYADEDEETYTKTTTSDSSAALNVYGGTLTAIIAADVDHTFSGYDEEGNNISVLFSADGDGLDSNGTMNLDGGYITVLGTASGNNSAIDYVTSYTIGSGVTILALGASGMNESVTTANQSYVEFGGMSMGANIFGSTTVTGEGPEDGNFTPGDNTEMPSDMQNGNTSSFTLTLGYAYAILDSSGNTVVTDTADKAYTYVFYTSPSVTSSYTYTLTSNGTEVASATAN
ncbi:MAG: carbohydrate-binding domain-containing protein [Eubacterium sp.]|nr:carbohydrate-binding domain-containing protein [Eubacterium sp.]